jgi:integrase
MPKIAKALTAVEIKRLTEPGLHTVGTVAGLRLRVKESGARSWVLRTMVGSRRAEIGLGGYPTVTLAQAVDYAREALQKIRMGTDPAAERRALRSTVESTFKKTAEDYIKAHRAGWKNAKHALQWESTLEAYVYPVFGNKHVRDITKADVLVAIEPIWSTKNETASRVRNRIELVLSYAMQKELRPEGLNPARWRGNLDMALPRLGKSARVKHHAALGIDDMHSFMKRLADIQGMGARALEFVILTAARSGEVRGATWAEIDTKAGVWSIPAERMKSSRPHRVPLSALAIKLLKSLPKFEGVDLVFAGKEGKALSDMTLTAVLRRMEVPATTHGFRSTFRDWAAERTAVPSEVAEMALAHAVGDQTEAAYRRGDLFDKRRELMTLWAKYLGTPPSTGNVKQMPKRSAK